MPQQSATSATIEPPWLRHELRVPREDRTLFARPPFGEALRLAENNREQLGRLDLSVQGRTLAQLREWTRSEAARAAREYTSRLIDAELPEPRLETIVVGGHQPTPFHPGVWVKNFALAGLARRSGGTGMNLVVDNDLLATTRVRMPVGDGEHPGIEMVAWDEERPPLPWEEAELANRELFASFGARATERMGRWGIVPLAAGMWPDAVVQLSRSPLVRDAFTAARAQQERRWGVSNLELPLSRLCELDPFLWFTSHVLAHLPRFRDVHNGVLREYRRVNRIRSRTHPVAELQELDGWLEAPLWVWRKGDHQRGRVFARQIEREVHLSDGRETFARLRLAPEMDACCAVEGLRELPEQGIRFRTRALTTTLFARLCLADLFVHGIGGAKYDEMTDRMITRFFGLPAPGFATISATLHLPLARAFDATAQDKVRLHALLRELRWNPERHLDRGDDAETALLLDRKQRLVEEQRQAKRGTGLNRRERRQRNRTNRERYRELQDVTHQLAEHVAPLRQQVAREREVVRGRIAANAILQDREFAFWLFPEEALRPFLTGLADR